MTITDSIRRHSGTSHIEGLGQARASAHISKTIKAKITGALALLAYAGGAIADQYSKFKSQRVDHYSVYSANDNILTTIVFIGLLLMAIFAWAG